MFRPAMLTVLLTLTLLVACDDDPKKTNNHTTGCGNGLAEPALDEQCDGTDLQGLDCRSLLMGFDGGLLACDSSCHLDTSGCLGCDDLCDFAGQIRCNPGGSGIETCGPTEAGCLAWENEPCAEATPFCVLDDETPTCAAACTDACTIDDVRCSTDDDAIETCVTGGAGCTVWEGTPCAIDTPVCVDSVGTPTCTMVLCEDACTPDETRCNGAGDGVETCVAGSPCNSWQNTPCDVAMPVCALQEGSPACIAPNGDGESCADVRRIPVPFTAAGLDFTADYATRDLALSHASCDAGDVPAGHDAVFEIDLAAGEAVVFTQGGGLDGQLYVQGACDGAGACLDALDQAGVGGVEELLFEAPATGTYTLILAAYSSAPVDTRYIIAVYRWEDPAELSCDDGFDNDFDDVADCADPDCFGVAGACDSEIACGDGLDNDGDGHIDCFDSECTGQAPCGVESGEARCTDGVDNDADGATDCADPACAGNSYCPVVLIAEGFEAWPPAGWTIVNGGDPAHTWGSSADSGRSLSGATGLFAVVDSDAPSATLDHDESLITPAFSCVGYTNVSLSFLHTYRDYSGTDSASVALSTNGGTTWTPLATYLADTTDGATVELSATTACAGSPSAVIRFRYVSSWDWYWLLDEVRVVAW
ncbi:choice-of-anchor J domain-containing protein [Myxococcota bacterium]|nr:choice-of-anchor J domain-containing protein [Myxococcota bacterium]